MTLGALFIGQTHGREPDESQPRRNVFIAGKMKKWRGSLVWGDMARFQRLAQEARDALLAG